MVFGRYLEERHETERSARRHGVNVIEDSVRKFDDLWASEDTRMALLPPKEVLHLVNQKLQDGGAGAVSIRALSSRLKPDEIPAEMRDFLLQIDEYLAPAALSKVQLGSRPCRTRGRRCDFAVEPHAIVREQRDLSQGSRLLQDRLDAAQGLGTLGCAILAAGLPAGPGMRLTFPDDADGAYFRGADGPDEARL